ncbi:MAG: hypothetical protein IPL32_11630 [Chloracidobacterium sp.]|nr:hypothetical protein [Chloracidobacterium sp.]
MLRIILLFAVLLVICSVVACSQMSSGGGGGATPTEAYKLLYAAVKSKDTEAIKKLLTKKSIEFGAMASQRNGTPLEKVYENGFTATTFSATLPTMRDERIDGDMGALEVWNSKESKWEDLAFIKEDGSWKLAVGDMFAGTYKSPGPGRDVVEKQAANAAANSDVQSPPILNSNAPMPGINTASNKAAHSNR